MIAITFNQADKDCAHQEIVCKLQVSEKNNGLRVMCDEALQRNTQMLKEKEQQEAVHQQMQRKTPRPREKNGSIARIYKHRRIANMLQISVN